MNEKETKDATKELNEQETEKVVGGKYLPLGPGPGFPPIRPPRDDKKDGDRSGGATGGW